MTEGDLQAGDDTDAYKHPPIIRRIFSVVADIPPDDFASLIDSWGETVAESFPVKNPIVEWILQTDEVKISEDSGVPLFENLTPQVRITPQFESHNARGKTVWNLRCPSDRFQITLHSELDQTHSFEELNREIAVWLPRWAAHFDIKGFKVVMLDYVNLLGRRTTPKFIEAQSQSLEVERMLRVFSKFEGNHLSIIQPYDCQAGFLYSENPARALRLRVHGLPPSQFSPEVRVDFQAIMHNNGHELVTTAEALADLKTLHGMVIERFNQVFTDEAKESFR